MSRGDDETSSVAWFRPPPDDPFVKDWMRVVPMHQRPDIIGQLAVNLMNVALGEPWRVVHRLLRKVP